MIIREIEERDIQSVYELVLNYKIEQGRELTEEDKKSLSAAVKNLPGFEERDMAANFVKHLS